MAVGLMAVGLAWVLVLLVYGGFEFTVLGTVITSNEPLRPAALAALGFGVYLWTRGLDEAARRWEALAWRVEERWVVMVLALFVAISGVVFGSTTAGGSDSYGYVSQADLWLAGRLDVDQPWAAEVPWPEARWTFSPLGYRPSPDANATTIVPTYAPGVPMLMAVAKLVGGQEAMFWVVPIFGMVLVWATYGIGCRLGSRPAGLVGAALVALSPPMLFMLMVPMIDVPVAATWAVACYFLLGPGLRNAVLAGLAAGVALLIRPNLPLQALAMGVWYLLRLPQGGVRVAGHAFAFVAAMLPGVVTIAWLNDRLYGSPLASGYGALDALFSWAYIWPNLQRYPGWLIETHTMVVLAGVVALLVPLRRFWPDAPDRRAVIALALFVLANWGFYLAYLPFDDWWYLRFLLPSLPFILVGLGAVIAAVYRTGRPALVFASVGTVLALGAIELRKSTNDSAFDMWQERRFPGVALRVADLVPNNSVVLASLHSGSLRYYGGRMTMRYEYLEPAWLDRSISWLDERGVEVYLLLEGGEVEAFRTRFAGQQALAALDGRPRLDYRAGDWTVVLYRLSASLEPAIERRFVIEPFPPTLRSLPPVPPPGLAFFGKAR